LCDNASLLPEDHDATKIFPAVLFVVLSLTASSLAQPKKAAAKTSGGPDKTYLQKIWDGWATLDPSNQGQYYAQGPHTFFDIAPLKYGSWDEYQKGVVNVLADSRLPSSL